MITTGIHSSYNTFVFKKNNIFKKPAALSYLSTLRISSSVWSILIVSLLTSTTRPTGYMAVGSSPLQRPWGVGNAPPPTQLHNSEFATHTFQERRMTNFRKCFVAFQLIKYSFWRIHKLQKRIRNNILHNHTTQR